MKVKTTIKKDSSGEWVVRLHVNGKFETAYFTDDKQDAEDTAKMMVKSRKAKKK